MKEKKKQKKIESDEWIVATENESKGQGICTDPFGSYTGVPTEGSVYDQPVQDVDDL